MDFLKKHYEKVLLGAVLLGLSVAVGFLFLTISSEKRQVEEKQQELTNPQVKPLPDLDLAAYEGVLQKVGVVAVVDFSAPHKLFNPMPWQKTPDGRLVRPAAQDVGPKAVQVTKLNPLHLELSLVSSSVEDNIPKFLIGVKKEASPVPRERVKTEKYVKVGDKTDVFVLKEIGGPADNPTNIVLELNDTHERAVVSKDHPFQRVDGYTADLKYTPENRVWPNRRVSTPPPLSFGGEEYDIVSINQNEVVLRARSNQKKWPISYNPNSPNPK